MLDHVLVPLDGSQLGEAALVYARRLVGEPGKITLLTAVDVPEIPMYGLYPATTVPDYHAAVQEAVPQAKTYLERVAESLKQFGPTVDVEAQIGDAADVIVQAAQKLGVDAVVMSTHGRSGLSRWLFGSVTSKVLSAKVCPVMVIPSKVVEEEAEERVEVRREAAADS